MFSSARDLLTDSLLLAGVLRRPDEARIKNTKDQLLPALLDSKFFQDDSQRTKLGESELKKVQADEGRKKEPVCALKKWTGLDA